MSASARIVGGQGRPGDRVADGLTGGHWDHVVVSRLRSRMTRSIFPRSPRWESSMKESRRTEPAQSRDEDVPSVDVAEPTGHGFSRPLPSREGSSAAASRGPGASPSRSRPTRSGRSWSSMPWPETRNGRRSYLAKPGCNVVLGMAHRARTMVKRSRILRFLRDDRPPTDGPPSGPSRSASGPPGGRGRSLSAEHAPRGIAGRVPGPDPIEGPDGFQRR